MTAWANLADEMLNRLQLRLIDADDIPPPWDDIVLHYSLGLKEREIDNINRRNNGGDYAVGGGMMSKQKKMEVFRQHAEEQAARQRAREGRGGGDGGGNKG